MKLKITVDGKEYEVDVEVAPAEPPQGTVYTQSGHGPHGHTLDSPAPASDAPESVGDESKVIRSPLAGVVAKVEIKPGQTVEKDQEILVLEAMKMFTTITSPREGQIKAVAVAPTDAVKQGQVLVEFE